MLLLTGRRALILGPASGVEESTDFDPPDSQNCGLLLLLLKTALLYTTMEVLTWRAVEGPPFNTPLCYKFIIVVLSGVRLGMVPYYTVVY